MTHTTEPTGNPLRPAGGDCWKRIGVRGDRSCPELAEHVHCRNCPVYGTSLAGLLDREPPPGYAREWARHFARPRGAGAGESRSVLLFRIGPEWLALSTATVVEVARPRSIHSLPHRKNPVVLGVANVRGELLVCVSLARLLGVDGAPGADSIARRAVYPRLLVVQGEGGRLGIPSEEVHGIHRVEQRDVQSVPTTLAKARATYTHGLFEWRGHSVGQLDDRLLLYALDRSLA